MLTIVEAQQILDESVQEVTQVPAPTNIYDTLEYCGIHTSSQLDLLRARVRFLVEQRHHRIDSSTLGNLNRNSTIRDVVQTISRFSLQGDETFEEPPDESTDD